jgi:DNA mismatch repair ATPase MutL
MKEIALHLLDIAENSVSAQSSSITIQVTEDLSSNRLRAVVVDNGRGMDADFLARVIDPFVTTRTTRKVGLGIPLLKEAAEACNGGLEITSCPGQGTTLSVEFQRDHIDRMPLGDLSGTFLTLVVSYPAICWNLEYQAMLVDERHVVYQFDNSPLQEALGDVSWTEPNILSYLRTELDEGIRSVRKSLPDAF